METQEMNDIAKEVIIILENCQDEIIKMIPQNFLDYLKELSKTSCIEVNIDKEKKIEEQEISNDSKNLIALIYYSYIADEGEKKCISEIWSKNEKQYKQELEEKYNFNNVLNNKNKDNKKEITNLPIEVKKVNLFEKILDFIYKIFKKS